MQQVLDNPYLEDDYKIFKDIKISNDRSALREEIAAKAASNDLKVGFSELVDVLYNQVISESLETRPTLNVDNQKIFNQLKILDNESETSTIKMVDNCKYNKVKLDWEIALKVADRRLSPEKRKDLATQLFSDQAIIEIENRFAHNRIVTTASTISATSCAFVRDTSIEHTLVKFAYFDARGVLILLIGLAAAIGTDLAYENYREHRKTIYRKNLNKHFLMRLQEKIK